MEQYQLSFGIEQGHRSWAGLGTAPPVYHDRHTDHISAPCVPANTDLKNRFINIFKTR